MYVIYIYMYIYIYIYRPIWIFTCARIACVHRQLPASEFPLLRVFPKAGPYLVARQFRTKHFLGVLPISVTGCILGRPFSPTSRKRVDIRAGGVSPQCCGTKLRLHQVLHLDPIMWPTSCVGNTIELAYLSWECPALIIRHAAPSTPHGRLLH